MKAVGTASHQSCLMLTSTETPKEIAALSGVNLPVRSLKLGSLGDEAENILRDKGLSSSSADRYSELISAYDGNPLALKIVATTIQDMFDGSIDTFLSNYPVLGDFADRLSRHIDRLSELERQILYRLGTEVKPVAAEQLRSDMQLSSEKLLQLLESLVRRSLINSIKPASEILCTIPPVVGKYLRG
ncbi:MAG: hypothetical protein AB4352_25965 [Hormoscilla sp.]